MIIWPQYIDARLTPSQGRRVTKAQAVDDPIIPEMMRVLQFLGFPEVYADMQGSYPRAQSQGYQIPPTKGCLHVTIKPPKAQHYVRKSEFDTATRGHLVDGLENKHKVLVKLAEMIKTRPDRNPRPLGLFQVMPMPGWELTPGTGQQAGQTPPAGKKKK